MISECWYKEQNRRQRVSQARRDDPPAPAACACVTGAQVEDLYLAALAVGAKMTPAQIAEAQKTAREWKPK